MEEKDKYPINNYETLKFKLLLKKKYLSKFSDIYLKTLEDEVYENAPETEKIKYELLNLEENPGISTFFEKYIYIRLLDETTELIHEKDLDIELLKRNISTLQIIRNRDYAFYGTIKNMDNDYFEYVKSLTKSDRRGNRK